MLLNFPALTVNGAGIFAVDLSTTLEMDISLQVTYSVRATHHGTLSGLRLGLVGWAGWCPALWRVRHSSGSGRVRFSVFTGLCHGRRVACPTRATPHCIRAAPPSRHICMP